MNTNNTKIAKWWQAAKEKRSVTTEMVMLAIQESIPWKIPRMILLWIAAKTLRPKGKYSILAQYIRLASVIIITRPSILEFLVKLLCKEGSELERALLLIVDLYDGSNVDYFVFITATIVVLCILYLDYKIQQITANEELNYRLIKESIRPIISFNEFEEIYDKHGVKQFVDDQEYINVRKIIGDYSKGHVRLLALSGSGKTFLIQSAFREAGDTSKVFYCDAALHPDLPTAVINLMQEVKGATLFLDNCPSRICDEIISMVGNEVRIVSAYFDPLDNANKAKTYKLADCNMGDIVARIIDENVSIPITDDQRNKLIYHSGNIPFMAILLVHAFNKANGVFDAVETSLLNHLLDMNGQNPTEHRIAMRTLALCQPFNFDNANSEFAKFLIKSDNFTPIEANVKRKLLFRTVVKDLYARNLLDMDSVFVNVRPQPLAIWLMGEWIKEQGAGLINTITELAQQDNTIKKPILDAWSMRLEYMQGNPDAENLYADLVKVNGGPFAHEDVVCSDFGSRLILAMSTVNPVAVVDCLYAVLNQKPIEWLYDNLTGDARRNVVRTLEKLCFCCDSFKKASKVLARLALAENEDWANNSKGQFVQLFHVLLPGTEANLVDRYTVLEDLYESKIEYHPLILGAIKGCFALEHLHRMGGAEMFGFKELHDYRPDDREIDIYWTNIFTLLQRWMNEHPEDVGSIAEVIAVNTRHLVRGHRVDLLIDFIKDIHTRLGGEWESMQKALIDTTNYDRMSDAQKQVLKEWIARLEPKDIIGRMQKAVHELYASRNFDKITEREEEIVKPFVEEFIRERAFLGKDMDKLISTSDHISWAFSYHLSLSLLAEDIVPLGDYLLQLLSHKDKDFYSHLLVNVYSHLCDNVQTQHFVQELYNKGYYAMALPIMAVTDDAEKHNLVFVLDEVKKGCIEISEVRRYFNAIRLHNANDIWDMLNILKSNNPDISLQFDFVSNYWYLDDLYQNQELITSYKQILLDYPVANNSHYNYEYSRQLQNVLEKVDDSEFAKAVNSKLINILSSHANHDGLDEVYNILLTKYRSDIWLEFIEALVDIDNRAGFCFQLRYKIGSGFDFGEGTLFKDHYEEMKQVCFDFPKYGPWVCAAMCPVFADANPETGDIEQFHPFVIWLFENFGNDKLVLDEFHSNMGTFHWTGSVIPLIEDRRRCLEDLKARPNMSKTVIEWADESLKINNADYERENKSEAFMRMAYRHK